MSARLALPPAAASDLARRRVSETACRIAAVLDARDPRHLVLAKYRRSVPAEDRWRARQLRGDLLEVVGLQRRAVCYSGVIYSWDEYLLWNPYKGYRWMVESNGHWLLMKTVETKPEESSHG